MIMIFLDICALLVNRYFQMQLRLVILHAGHIVNWLIPKFIFTLSK